ncbi:putative defense protein Hdd11 [Neosynchiropus ocellatus]
MLSSTLLLLQALCLVHGYPTGAPTGACEDMMPRHAGVTPQQSPPPYTLLVDKDALLPGEPITVTIIGPAYRGVLLEARSGDSVQAVGSFTNPPPDTKLLTCSGNTAGAVTHSNTNVKDNTTVYRWIPPTKAPPSAIYFMATVAQQRSVYWLNVRSKTLTQAGISFLGSDASHGPDHSKVLLILLLGLLFARG